MRGRQLFAAVSCACILLFCAGHLRPQQRDGSDSAKQKSVETSMATDERLEGAGWWPTKQSAALDEFIGTKECGRCHGKIVATQVTTPMAQAERSAADAAVLKAHDKISNVAGAYTYEITRDDSGSAYSVSDGVKTISEPVGWAFGLGNKGQTYVYERGELFYESRMSFYKSLQGLSLTTGHPSATPANLEAAMGRLLDQDSVQHCFGCHTTASTTAAGFDPAHGTPGVTCEACHGPGLRHAELMDEEKNAEGRAAIFNPRSLSAVASVDFCGACHRTLNDVYEMGMRGVANVRFQPYRLENSRCWGDGDTRLACVACHDPHQPLDRVAGDYDQKCLACHVVAPKKASREQPGKACPVSTKDCVTCHMPRVELPSMHAPFVDHRIRIVRANEKYPD